MPKERPIMPICPTPHARGTHRSRRLRFSVLLLSTVVLGGVLSRAAAPPRPVSGAVAFASQARTSGAGASSITTAAFHDATPPGLPAVMESTAAWGDYDNDGRQDMLLTGL